MDTEDLALLKQANDLYWDIKDAVSELETRARLSGPLKAVLLSTVRDGERIKARLQEAAHPRRKRGDSHGS